MTPFERLDDALVDMLTEHSILTQALHYRAGHKGDYYDCSFTSCRRALIAVERTQGVRGKVLPQFQPHIIYINTGEQTL